MSDNVELMPLSAEQGRLMHSVANFAQRLAPGITLVGALAVLGCSSSPKPVAAEHLSPSPSVSVSASPTAEACSPANILPNDVHGADINRPFEDGLTTEQGKKVGTLSEFQAAVIRGIRRDTTTLRYEAQSYNLPTPALAKLGTPLSNGRTCRTSAGSILVNQVEGIVLASNHASIVLASANDRNSGVDASGNMVAEAHNGISGNRAAIITFLPDGTRHTQLLRCGNLTNPAPGTPIGPTDQPPRPPRPTVPPKHDDGILPQVPGAAPAEQDPGTPGQPGRGPAGQPVSPTGTVAGEKLPTQAPYNSASPTPKPGPTSSPQPSRNPETGAPQPSTTPVPVVTVSPQATATMPPQPN